MLAEAPRRGSGYGGGGGCSGSVVGRQHPGELRQRLPVLDAGWSSITGRGGHGVASGRILVHLGCLIVPVALANDQNGARLVGDISATDWEAIARQAEAAVAGDQKGAQVAREIAQRDDRASNGQESLGSILRKAIKIALMYGRPILPN